MGVRCRCTSPARDEGGGPSRSRGPAVSEGPALAVLPVKTNVGTGSTGEPSKGHTETVKTFQGDCYGLVVIGKELVDAIHVHDLLGKTPPPGPDNFQTYVHCWFAVRSKTSPDDSDDAAASSLTLELPSPFAPG